MASCKPVEPGRYKILMRPLRPRGTEAALSHWQFYVSNIFLFDIETLILVPYTSSSHSSHKLGYYDIELKSRGGKKVEQLVSFSSRRLHHSCYSEFTTRSFSDGPGVKSPTIEEVRVTKPCTSRCDKSVENPKDKVTVTKSCTTGCNGSNKQFPSRVQRGVRSRRTRLLSLRLQSAHMVDVKRSPLQLVKQGQ